MKRTPLSNRRSFGKIGLLTLGLMLTCGSIASAQYRSPDGRYFPLNQRTPPGVVSQWQAIGGRIQSAYYQPVKVTLPTQGQVRFFQGQPDLALTLKAPAQANMLVGQVYRMEISGMPEFPGVALYPSVEVIDRLHPPEGVKDQFPIPLVFTVEEIADVIKGSMVSKVVYLEQPQLANPYVVEPNLEVTELSSRVNLLAEADRRGRPMAIIRFGGRLPDKRNPLPGFYGNGAPIQPSAVNGNQPVGKMRSSFKVQPAAATSSTPSTRPGTARVR